MIVLFFISALSLHSFWVHGDPFYIFLEHEKEEMIDTSFDNQDVDEVKMIKVKTISNEKKAENVELTGELDLDFSGNSLENDILEENDYLGDEYEEIIFDDNFDKEYWSGTDDNYLE